MKSKDKSTLDNVAFLLSDKDPDWQLVLHTVVSAYQCDTGTLHFLEPKTNLLEVKAHLGIPDFLVPKLSVIPIGKGMAGIAAERRAPVEMCNLQTDSSGVARPSAKETKVEGSIAVPLLFKDNLYGVIGIGKRVPYDFSPSEIKELVQIAEAIGQVVANN